MNKGKEIRKKSFDDSVRQCNGACGQIYPATEEYFLFRKSSKNGKMYPSSSCLTCERAKAAAIRRTKYATAEGKAKILEQNRSYHIRKNTSESN